MPAVGGLVLVPRYSEKVPDDPLKTMLRTTPYDWYIKYPLPLTPLLACERPPTTWKFGYWYVPVYAFQVEAASRLRDVFHVYAPQRADPPTQAARLVE